MAEARDGNATHEVVLERCESCGLGLVRGGDAALRPGGDRSVVTAPNRRSWQAGLGGSHWAAIDPAAHDLYATPESLSILLEKQGLEAQRVRQPVVGRNQLWMWQTLLNGLTFHDNFAVDVLGGRLRAGNAGNFAAFAIDAVVSVLAALPVALISFPLELLAVVARRGGLIEAEVKRLRE